MIKTELPKQGTEWHSLLPRRWSWEEEWGTFFMVFNSLLGGTGTLWERWYRRGWRCETPCRLQGELVFLLQGRISYLYLYTHMKSEENTVETNISPSLAS